MPDPVVDAIRAKKLSAVRAALNGRPKPRATIEAARWAFLPALEFLRSKGASLNASFANYRPLHALLQEEPHAAAGRPSQERLACLEWMLANGADPEETGGWPLARGIVVAAFMGIPEYVERLRAAGANIDGFAAAALGDLKGVKRAISADPEFANARDDGGLTPLQCAAGSRMTAAAKSAVAIATLLLDAGADPRALVKSWGREVDALYFAVGAKRDDVYKLVLDRGADASSALSHSVWANRFDLAELALERGGDPDRATANGKPLLNDLIRWGRIDGTEWLLRNGASPNVPDADGWTALHQAASRGNARMVKAALAAGGDPDHRDKLGHTPLDVARIMRRGKLVPLLS
jgi:ankyrin repeat protein